MTWELAWCVGAALIVGGYGSLWWFCRSLPMAAVDDGRPDPDDAGFWKAAFDNCDAARCQLYDEFLAADERAETAEGLVAAVQETLAEVREELAGWVASAATLAGSYTDVVEERAARMAEAVRRAEMHAAVYAD